MRNWNNISSQDRIILWRKFREDIKSDVKYIPNICKFFQDFPIGGRSLDFYNPKSWPTPWEILHHGTFCKNSISLLVYYTIKLIDEDVDVKMFIIDDSDDRFIVPVINDVTVLNYHSGLPCDITDIENLKIISIFTDTDIQTIS